MLSPPRKRPLSEEAIVIMKIAELTKRNSLHLSLKCLSSLPKMVNVAVGEVVDPIVAKVIVSIAERELEGRCEAEAPPLAKVTTEVMEDTRVMVGTSRGHSLRSLQPKGQMGTEVKALLKVPNTTKCST